MFATILGSMSLKTFCYICLILCLARTCYLAGYRAGLRDAKESVKRHLGFSDKSILRDKGILDAATIDAAQAGEKEKES